MRRCVGEKTLPRMKLFLRSPCRKNRRICAMSLAIWVLCLVGARPSSGQTLDATISGTITSALGAPSANATITVKNLATNDVRSLTANPDGTYALQNVAPGRYEITASASASGYATVGVTITKEFPILSMCNCENSLMFSTTRISFHHSIIEISLIRQEVRSATRD
jgi:hypothetical protein